MDRRLRAGVVVPVGPGQIELDRLADVIESLRASVVGLDALVLVDDGDAPRDLGRLTELTHAPLSVLRPDRPGGRRHPFDAMTTGTLTFARWLAASEIDYVVKLDTDALLIADFRPSLERAIARRPEVGVWGAHRYNQAGGGLRDFSVWDEPLRRLQAAFAIQPRRWRRLPGLHVALHGRALRVRRFLATTVAAAEANGYERGEHCLGGAYALTAAAARAMAQHHLLDDPLVLDGSHLGEDVVLGLLVRAAGFELDSLVAEGEAFGVRYQGLLASPDTLVDRGHAIVHSVKDSEYGSESEVRAQFRRRRSLASGPSRNSREDH